MNSENYLSSSCNELCKCFFLCWTRQLFSALHLPIMSRKHRSNQSSPWAMQSNQVFFIVAGDANVSSIVHYKLTLWRNSLMCSHCLVNDSTKIKLVCKQIELERRIILSASVLKGLRTKNENPRLPSIDPSVNYGRWFAQLCRHHFIFPGRIVHRETHLYTLGGGCTFTIGFYHLFAVTTLKPITSHFQNVTGETISTT